jgi:hypothetical protein
MTVNITIASVLIAPVIWINLPSELHAAPIVIRSMNQARNLVTGPASGNEKRTPSGVSIANTFDASTGCGG